jgi:hypothetical protein
MSKFAQSQTCRPHVALSQVFCFVKALNGSFQRASVTFLVLVVESGDGLNDGSSK